MTMTESQQLLGDYVTKGSEEAFQELVARYVDLVYSTAIRLVEGDPHRAKDVAQTVFVDLSRAAAKLAPNSMLGGWLHRHTCFVARTVMRGERRRQARERRAMEMSALDNQPDMALAEIAPVLDEAINELGADDRDAILLRFFERRNLRSVGEALGTSENVAQKRVARAVQELGTLLRRRGFIVPAAALATGLAAGAVTAAPAGLALSIAGTIFAGAGAAGGSGLTFAKAVVMAKLQIGIVGAIVVAGVVTAVFVQHQSKAKLHEESVLVQSQPDQPDSGDQRGSEPASPEITKPPSIAPLRQAPRAKFEAPPIAGPVPDVVSQPPRQSVAVPEQTVVDNPALPIQRFVARSGSRIRIEGTANIIHPTWQIESPIIGGSMEVGPNFPTEPGQAVSLGKVHAKAHAFIQVRSLESVKEDGSHYDDHMDEVMYEHLKEAQFKRILYNLDELTLKEAPKTEDAPYVFEAKGEATVAGVTNNSTMVVKVLPLADKKLQITGSTVVKMTDFKVEPVDINLVLGHIKTGDEVRIRFDWVVAPKSAPSIQTQTGMEPLILDLPAPAFKGTPKDLKLGPNVEPISDKPRPPMMVPPGLKNIALGSQITCSDMNATADTLAKITDSDKDASDQSIIFLRKGTQWVQMDFGNSQEIFAIVIWHAHNMAKVYHGVIVQVADDPDFLQNVRTILNNDADNTSGLGMGTNREYIESYEGKLINAAGVKTRYLRFYSKGSTESALSEYTEIEAYGRQAQ